VAILASAPWRHLAALRFPIDLWTVAGSLIVATARLPAGGAGRRPDMTPFGHVCLVRRVCAANAVRVGVEPGRAEVEAADLLDAQSARLNGGCDVTTAEFLELFERKRGR
jgi:hypothetical protein